MKRINSLLSVEKTRGGYVGAVRNGKNKGEIFLRTNLAYKDITFSSFFQQCIELYEIYLCCNCNFETFYSLFEGNTDVTKKDLELFFMETEDTALQLETVYGEKLKYFLYKFITPSRKVGNKKFFDMQDKLNFLTSSMVKRVQSK